MKRQPWHITEEMFLSTGELDQLLGGLDSSVSGSAGRERLGRELDRFIVRGLVFSGLRNSEFCRLRLADSPVGEGRPVFIVRGGPGESRTVFIPGRLAEEVGRYVDDVRTEFAPKGEAAGDLSGALVLNEHRRPYERTSLYRRVVRILTDHGLGDRASVQLLRHTYGYLAYKRSGGNLLFVQRQLGHAHAMITSIYSQFVEERYEELAERISVDGADGSRAFTAEKAPARVRTERGDWNKEFGYEID